MRCKYICLREAYDYIEIGNKDNNLSCKEVESINKYLESKYKNKKIIDFKINKVRFINYTGIIALDNLVIEILPKISLTDDENNDRKMLIKMLTLCNKLSINIEQSNSISTDKNNLLEILCKIFIENLENEIKKGLHLEYISESENINTLKGKLLLKEHIHKNYSNKSKAYCKYDSYSCDNFLNQILKYTCNLLVGKINDEKIDIKIKKILKIFSDVSDISVSKEKMNNFKFNMQNERFKLAFEIAKLILNNESSKNSYGNKNAFSLLYEMNILYEEYIGRLVSIVYSGENRRVKLQDDSNHLLVNINTDRNNVKLKPDIVLYDNEKANLIIDTKWKGISYNGRINYNQADVYQMYAYVNGYKDSKRCILLYPKLDDNDKLPIWKVESEDKYIELRTVRLDSIDNTLDDLKNIIYKAY